MKNIARNLGWRIYHTVQYSGVDTNVNSQTFGQVSRAAAMRSFNYTARYRF